MLLETRRFAIGAFAGAIVLLTSLPASAAELRVAAASSTQDALAAVAREFQRLRGVKVVTTFGSSGKLYHQILRGAPYDVFLSADEVFPEKLEREGLVSARRRYARGRIVLWAPHRSPVDPSRGLKVLGDPRVRKVAIANPRLAPYGHAASAALRASGLEAGVSPKLVFGESVSHAAHFVSSGAAEVGFLSLSLALSPRLAPAGRFWLVPETLHPPLFAGAVALEAAREPQAASDFLAFCVSPAGQAIWGQFGLELAK